MRPVRLRRILTRGGQMPKGAVYVGRPTRWGNPYKVGTPAAPTHEATVRLYREHLARNQARMQPTFPPIGTATRTRSHV